MSEATERQKRALAELTTEAKGYGVEIRDANDFRLTFEEEFRPGRGSDLHAHYVDGENVVYAYFDVYGNGNVSIGAVEWIHQSGDEQCACDPCVRYRADDEDEPYYEPQSAFLDLGRIW